MERLIPEPDADALDPIFHALSDRTRRAIVRRLAMGEAPVRVLAAPFPISIQAVSKHIQVLVQAGLVEREVRGREHYCRLQPAGLLTAQEWLSWAEAYWTPRLDAFAELFAAPATDSAAPGEPRDDPSPPTRVRPVAGGAAGLDRAVESVRSDGPAGSARDQ